MDTFASIEREIFIEADPEVVFAVISQPEHVKEWFPDDAEYAVVPGGTGQLTFRDGDTGDTVAVEPLTVVAVDYPTKFAFTWAEGLLVTFTLERVSGGTLLKFAETGFRELGWDDAKVADRYRDHLGGWNQILPRLAPYAAGVGATS